MTFIITLMLCAFVNIMFVVADRAAARRKRAKWPMKIIITFGFVMLVIVFGLISGWILTFAIKDTLQVFFAIMGYLISLVLWCATVVGKREDEMRKEYFKGCDKDGLQ